MNSLPEHLRLVMTVPEAAAQLVATALENYCVAVSAFELQPGGDWIIEAVAVLPPDPEALAVSLAEVESATGVKIPLPRIEALPDIDWLAENRKSFVPIRTKRFFIRPSHSEESPPAGAIVLTIDAATAFGTGSHETTRGCLLMLENLAKKYRHIRRSLDMGCGTGILGFAAAHLWSHPARVLGVDLDPESVRVANNNAKINHLAPLFHAVAGPGYRAPGVGSHAPYDLIIANILAPPLVAMAENLTQVLARDGIAVLSGFLFHQERQVLSRHEVFGLRRIARLRLGDWMVVALRR